MSSSSGYQLMQSNKDKILELKHDILSTDSHASVIANVLAEYGHSLTDADVIIHYYESEHTKNRKETSGSEEEFEYKTFYTGYGIILTEDGTMFRFFCDSKDTDLNYFEIQKYKIESLRPAYFKTYDRQDYGVHNFNHPTNLSFSIILNNSSYVIDLQGHQVNGIENLAVIYNKLLNIFKNQ